MPSTYPTGSVESALIMEVIPLALDVSKSAADSLNSRVLAVLEEMDARAARIRDLETALNNAADHAKAQEARIKTVEAERDAMDAECSALMRRASETLEPLTAERDALRADVGNLMRANVANQHAAVAEVEALRVEAQQTKDRYSAFVLQSGAREEELKSELAEANQCVRMRERQLAAHKRALEIAVEIAGDRITPEALVRLKVTSNGGV